MANKSEVQITLSLKDKASKQLAKFDKGLVKLRKSAVSTAKTLIANRFGLLALASAFAYGLRNQARYETSLTNIRNLTGLTDAEFNKLRDTITEMSKSSSKSLLDLSEAMFDVQSAGFAGAKANKVLEASMRLAVAGATTTKIAVDGVTGILNVYGDVIKSSTHASELLFATQQKGKTTVDKVSTSFGKYGATAKSLGVSITEALATIAEMTVQNIKADEASTKLVATMTGFANASREQIQIAKLYNIELGTQVLRDKGLLHIIGQISKAKKENADIVQLLFKGNVELSSGVNALITDYDRLLETEKAIRTSSEEVDKAYARSADTLEAKYLNALNQLNGALEKFVKIWKRLVVAVFGEDVILAMRGVGYVIDETITITEDRLKRAEKVLEKHNKSTEKFSVRHANLMKDLDDIFKPTVVEDLKKIGYEIGEGFELTDQHIMRAQKALKQYDEALKKRTTHKLTSPLSAYTDEQIAKAELLKELDLIFAPPPEPKDTTDTTDTTDKKGGAKVDKVAIETDKNKKILKSAVDTYENIDELRRIDLKAQIDAKKRILQDDVDEYLAKLERDRDVYYKKKEYLDKETTENRTELTEFLEGLDIKDEADLQYFENRLERMGIIRDTQKEDFKEEVKEYLKNKKAQADIDRKYTQAQLEQQAILNIARSDGLRGALDNVLNFALASLEAEFISQKARASFSALFADPTAIAALISLPIIRGVAKDALSNIDLAEGGIVYPTNKGTRLNVNGNSVRVGEAGQAEKLTVTPLNQNKNDYVGGGNVGDVFLDGKLVGKLMFRNQNKIRRQGLG